MTYAEWLTEAVALRERDQQMDERISLGFRVLRDLLISLFGLNIGAPPISDEARAKGQASYVPLAFVVGRPEVLKTLVERETAESAAAAPEYDAMADALVELGDMEPLTAEFARQDALAHAEDAEAMSAYLRSIGVALEDR